MTAELPAECRPTAIIDCDHVRVDDFVHDVTPGKRTIREQAVRLYYAVRDGIRYDPYTIDLSVPGMRASSTLAAGRAWCVPKAVLLAACCRALGIPAKVGFADVKNHLTTERLRSLMNTDVFYWHGYTCMLIEGRWVKATPAFNIELCRRFHLKPLEFDGVSDSLYHPYDELGNAHMEYIRMRGEYSDVPLDRIAATLHRRYGPLLSLNLHDFNADVQKERSPAN